jgi:hypothetical protein
VVRFGLRYDGLYEAFDRLGRFCCIAFDRFDNERLFASTGQGLRGAVESLLWGDEFVYYGPALREVAKIEGSEVHYFEGVGNRRRWKVERTCVSCLCLVHPAWSGCYVADLSSAQSKVVLPFYLARIPFAGVSANLDRGTW